MKVPLRSDLVVLPAVKSADGMIGLTATIKAVADEDMTDAPAMYERIILWRKFLADPIFVTRFGTPVPRVATLIGETMKTATKTTVSQRVTKSILDTIHLHFADSDFDQDEGEIKLIDQDESCLYFGLFETVRETGNLSGEPSIIWTVEVFADVEGGR